MKGASLAAAMIQPSKKVDCLEASMNRMPILKHTEDYPDTYVD
jgi:hypothetical protein